MNKINLILTLSFISFFSFSQNIEVNKDVKYDNLLQERKKAIVDSYVNDRIRIHIYNGELDACKKEIDNFKKKFADLDGAIEFYHPAYKVLIGNFKTRIEAERNLLLIKKNYPNAFIVKPRI